MFNKPCQKPNFNIVVSFVATFKINIWTFTIKYRDHENFIGGISSLAFNAATCFIATLYFYK